MAVVGLKDRDIHGASGQDYEPGGCAGGAWHQVSRDNRFLFRAVGGRNPGTNNVFDNGTPKTIYSINIEKLIASAADGKVDCNIDTAREVGQGHGDEADARPWSASCWSTTTPPVARTGPPRTTSTTPAVELRPGCSSPIFVARTGYDGNHRLYMASVDPATGSLSYDNDFRDENTGALGVDFNRKDWLGHPSGGFYKPHSMLFVTPGG
jgi:hypothetical protein